MSAERKCLHFKHICGCIYLYHVLLQKEATQKCTGAEWTYVQFVECFYSWSKHQRQCQRQWAICFCQERCFTSESRVCLHFNPEFMPQIPKSQTDRCRKVKKQWLLYRKNTPSPYHGFPFLVIDWSYGDVSGFSHNTPWFVRGSFGYPFLPAEQNLYREVSLLFSKISLEKPIIGKLQTWQDNFPLRVVDTESLSLSVETRAVCKIRQEYLDRELSWSDSGIWK